MLERGARDPRDVAKPLDHISKVGGHFVLKTDNKPVGVLRSPRQRARALLSFFILARPEDWFVLEDGAERTQRRNHSP